MCIIKKGIPFLVQYDGFVVLDQIFQVAIKDLVVLGNFIVVIRVFAFYFDLFFHHELIHDYQVANGLLRDDI